MEERPTDPGPRGAAGDVVKDRWRVTVDDISCIGSGSCVGIAPRHFRMAGFVSTPVHEFVAPDDVVLSAADACPAEAISVERD